jgi:hypothetical protein
MPQFSHGSDSPLTMQPETQVLLEQPLVPSPKPVKAYIWVKRNCGHSVPAAPPPALPFTAKLRQAAGFLAIQTCRGAVAGDEALYVAVVAANQLKP